MIEIISFILLLALGYGFGRYNENKHYQNLEEREKAMHGFQVITGEWKQHLESDDESELFGAGIVVAADYFKMFVSGLRSLFGGRMNAYESLLDRGRREAILRVQEKAKLWGADKLINLRVETSQINSSSGKRGLPCVELFVYATAIKKKNHV